MEDLLSQLLQPAQKKTEAEINALRNQQNLGMLLGGSSAGAGRPSAIGQTMYKEAANELSPAGDSSFDQMMKIATLQSLQSQRATQNELARQRMYQSQIEAQRAQEERAEKAEAKDQEALFTQAQKLEKTVGDLEPFQENLNTIRGIVSQYTPEEGEDIKLPGVGRFESVLPNFAVGEEGKQIRGALSRMRAALLKAQSGATVSEQEFNRMMDALNQSAGSSEEDMLKTLNIIQDELNSIMRRKVAVFRPDAVEQYFGRPWEPAPPVYQRPPTLEEIQARKAEIQRQIAEMDAAEAQDGKPK